MAYQDYVSASSKNNLYLWAGNITNSTTYATASTTGTWPRKVSNAWATNGYQTEQFFPRLLEIGADNSGYYVLCFNIGRDN